MKCQTILNILIVPKIWFAGGRKLSPTPNRMIPEPSVEKDEGISDDDDPAELRLLLELSEQEASVLRRKTEEMEMEAETMERKMKDLQEKLHAKTTTKKTVIGSLSKNSSLQEQKMKVLFWTGKRERNFEQFLLR